MKKAVMTAITVIMIISFAACIEPARRPYHDRIDIPDRISSQQERINQGFSSGELTRAETDMLQDNLNWIRNEYSVTKADGRITGEEWDYLDRYLEENSRMIYDKKHNAVRRIYSAPSGPGRSDDYDHKKDIPDRIQEQELRIGRGFINGELTRAEKDILQDNLNWIRNEYSDMKKDRGITREERDYLERYLEENSRMIYDKRNNAVRRLYRHSETPGIPEQISGQQRRIDQGIASGELTRAEADVLQDNLNWIKAEHARLARDGRLSSGELNKLQEHLNVNGEMIYNKKHNPVRRVY